MPEVSRNQPDQIGKLHIGDDEIDMIELENNIKVVPAVTIFGSMSDSGIGCSLFKYWKYVSG